VKNWRKNIENRDLPCFGQDVCPPLALPPIWISTHLNKWIFQERGDIVVCFDQLLLACVVLFVSFQRWKSAFCIWQYTPSSSALMASGGVDITTF